jgi:hypothetical protein
MPKGAGKGGKGGRIRGIAAGREKAYEAMKPTMGKAKAAKIANAGKTHPERVQMAKKAARTRKAKGK